MVIEMNMRERVARAIDPDMWKAFDDRSVRKEWTADERAEEFAEHLAKPASRLRQSLDRADAVLDALMEPDEGMLAGACDKHVPGQDMSPEAPRECPRIETRRRIWKKMLTAARSGRSGER